MRKLFWLFSALAVCGGVLVFADRLASPDGEEPVAAKQAYLAWQQSGTASEADKVLITRYYFPDSGGSRRALDAQGGPDAFGYEWVDNQGTDSAAFEWNELAGDPGAVHLLGTAFTSIDDGVTQPIAIGFDISFYGVSQDSLRIGTNGNIQFTTASTSLSNTCTLPSSVLGAAVMPFWDDLHLARNGSANGDNKVHYKNNGDHFIIEWDSIGFFSSGNPGALKFQVILYNDVRIKLQYQYMSGNLNGATIAIQQGVGGTSLTYGCNGTGQIPASGRAVWYHIPPLLTFDGQCMGILSPAQTKKTPGSLETVSFLMRNAGFASISPLEAAYRFDGGIPHLEAQPGVLNPGEVATFTFDTPLLLPETTGEYELEVWTSVIGEEDRTDDTCRMTLRVGPCEDAVINAPGTWTSSTCGGYDDCPHRVGQDRIVQVNVPYSGQWTIQLCDPIVNWDSYLLLSDQCCGPILGADDDNCPEFGVGHAQIACTTLTAGTYYVTVEPFSALVCSTFTLQVFDCALPPTGENVYTIPDLYFAGPGLIGQEVHVLCETVPDNILVALYGLYLENTPMPPYSYVRLAGGFIPAEDRKGTTILATGYLGLDFTAPPENNLTLTLTSYVALAVAALPVLPNWRQNWVAPDSCDTCKFAMLISGGVDTVNNRADYVDDLVDYYCYKRTHGWCESNIKVFYYNGDSTGHMDARIPPAVIDSAKQNKIQAWVNTVKARVAACRNANKKSSMEVVVTNHGSDAPPGINLLGDSVLSPADFTAMMQAIVDSGLSTMDIEFGQCFGGVMVNHLKRNLNGKQADITVASAADSAHSSWSSVRDPDPADTTGTGTIPGTGYNDWLFPKACALMEGKSIHEAVRRANHEYDNVLPGIAQGFGDEAQQYDQWAALPDSVLEQLDSTITADSLRRALQACAAAQRAESLKVMQSIRTEQYWRSVYMEKYCTWDTVQVTPGGRLVFTFSGETNACGNIEVYCKNNAGDWVKQVDQWNYNVPGSAGYQPGRETRKLDADSSSPGIYAIHSTSRNPYTVKVEAFNIRPPALDTDPSNPEDFAGFAFGGTTGNSDEFEDIVAPAVSITQGAGLDLSTMPRRIGSAGVQQLTVDYNLIQQNIYWTGMEIWLNVLSVSAGFQLTIQASNAQIPNQTVPITLTGEQSIFVGGVSGTGPRTLVLSSSSGSLELDSWGFRTLMDADPVDPATGCVNLRSVGPGGDINLNWNAAPGAASYNIYAAALPGGPYALIGTSPTNSFVDTGAVSQPFTRRFYYVTAVYP